MVAGFYSTAACRLLAVLIGVALWWPGSAPRPAGAESTAVVGCDNPFAPDLWARELGETKESDEKELEDGMAVEGSVGTRLGLAPHRLAAVDWIAHESAELDAREQDFERERGPPPA